eukprot:scaffold67_cov155-Skeletonema_menzelii.AAC.4
MIDRFNKATEEDNNSNDEDTGDYSSYWQSIPDPPMLDTASTSTSLKQLVLSNNDIEICQDNNDDDPEDGYPTNNLHQQSVLTPCLSSAAVEVVESSGQTASSTMTVKKKRLQDVTNQQQQQQKQQLLSIERRTNKKQRRSLLLPCDDNESSSTAAAADDDDMKSLPYSSSSSQHDAALTKVVATAVDTKPSSSSSTAGQSNDNNNINNNDQHTQQRLIQLVREYCALPNNTSQRIHSKQAQEIERLSSYPMPGTKFHLPIILHTQRSAESCTTNTNNDNDTNNNDERKQKSNTTTTTKSKAVFQPEFILHLKPIVQEMEHRKQTDTMESRTVTQCEMHKNRGRCYYVDVGTGEEVDPREYERRYLSWIGRRRVERLDRNRRRRSDDDDDDLKDGKTSPQLAEAAALAEEGSFDCESSFDMDQSVNMDDSMMSSAASSADDSMSEDVVAKTATFAARVIEPAAAAATSRSCASDTNDNTSTSNKDTSIRGLGLQLLPPSNDTRVLAARTKLWRAIDVALENYSKEILAIQQQQGQGS